MGASDYSVVTSFKAHDGVSPALDNITKKTNIADKLFDKLNLSGKGLGSCFQGTMQKANLFMTAIAGNYAIKAYQAVKDNIGACVDAASDLQETIGKTGEVFKTNTEDVLNWSTTSIKTMGLSKQTALDTASLYGDMATGMGMSTKRAAEMSTNLTQLSADLASFKNISQEIGKDALKGIFTGETEALKNLGVVMNETTLSEYARSIGIRKKLKDLSQAEKIELRYSYVLDKTKNAQGDFLRTGGGYANQRRIYEEQRVELKTRLGSIILPKQTQIMVSLNKKLTQYTPVIVENFSKMFKAFESGLKIVSPLFTKFMDLMKYLKDHLLPEIINYMPLIKTTLETVIVPAVSFVLDSVNILFRAIDKGYNVLKTTFQIVKDNWLPMLLILPASILGVRFAIDMLRLKIALAKMESSLFAAILNTNMITALKSFTGVVWRSVAALLAQAAAFAVTPLGMITIGITALIGVVILLWKNWDKITQTVTNWWNVTVNALSSFWEKSKSIFSQIGTFIKENFVDILFSCLGPIGWIIKGIVLVGQSLSSLKRGGGVNLKAGNSNEEIKNKIFVKDDSVKKGIINVGITVDNKTGFETTDTLELEDTNDLKLKPAA